MLRHRREQETNHARDSESPTTEGDKEREKNDVAKELGKKINAVAAATGRRP